VSASDEQVRHAAELYVAAWNENDPDALKEILSLCWHADGVIRSNFESIDGRAALYDRIKHFRSERPGDRPKLNSALDIHNGWFCFQAHVERPDGSRYSPAVDIGEVGDDGLIRRITTFHPHIA